MDLKNINMFKPSNKLKNNSNVLKQTQKLKHIMKDKIFMRKYGY